MKSIGCSAILTTHPQRRTPSSCLRRTLWTDSYPSYCSTWRNWSVSCECYWVLGEGVWGFFPDFVQSVSFLGGFFPDFVQSVSSEWLFSVWLSPLFLALLRKYNQVVQRYFVQYLAGYDSVLLNSLIQVPIQSRIMHNNFWSVLTYLW